MLSMLAQVDIPDIQWLVLIPHLVMAGAAVVLLTIVSLAGSRLPAGFAPAWTVAAGLGVLATAIPVWLRASHEGPSSTVAGTIGVDGFSVFVILLLACTVVLTALIADGFLHRESLDGPAFYVLLMLSAAGGMTMASANNLIVLFLGLEILSLAVYVLVAMHLRRDESQEAGIKYFVLGAFASAFLLYGIALVYGATGSINLIDIKGFLRGNDLSDNGLLLAGLAMLLVGFGFKVAAGAVPRLGPGRVPGGTFASGVVYGCRGESCGVRRLVASVRRRLRGDSRRVAAGGVRLGHRQPGGGLAAGHRPDRREADPGLLLDQPRWVHPGRSAGRHS